MRTKFTLIVCAVLFSLASVAQENTVTLKTTGSAETKEKAVQYALRSAIEQAFGAFISSNTEILNDELVADEITSVASGNIEKYDILSETVNEEGNSWFVTANVIVSVGKLTEFVQAKGVEVEVKGGLYAINIKQQKLNEESEYISLLNFYKVFHNQMLDAFDYQIDVLPPVKNKDQDWEIKMDVISIANSNMKFCEELMYSTLEGLAMSPEEVNQYKNLNKEVFSFAFFDPKWPKLQTWSKPSGYTTPLTKVIYNGDTLPCTSNGLFIKYPLNNLFGKKFKNGGHLSKIISEFPFLTKEDIIEYNPIFSSDYVYDADKDKIKGWDKSYPSNDWGVSLIQIPITKPKIYYLRSSKSAKLIEKIKLNLQELYIYDDESNFLYYGTGFDIFAEIAEYESYPLSKVMKRSFTTNSAGLDNYQERGYFSFSFFLGDEEVDNKIKILKLSNWSSDNYNKKYETGPNVELLHNYSLDNIFIFPKPGTEVIKTPFSCSLTLEELESISKFEVKKSESLIKIKHGGYFIPGSDFVSAISNVITDGGLSIKPRGFSRNDAVSYCESLNEFGYNDWQLTDVFSGIETAVNNPIFSEVIVSTKSWPAAHSTTLIKDVYQDYKERTAGNNDNYWLIDLDRSNLKANNGESDRYNSRPIQAICIRRIK